MSLPADVWLRLPANNTWVALAFAWKCEVEDDAGYCTEFSGYKYAYAKKQTGYTVKKAIIKFNYVVLDCDF